MNDSEYNSELFGVALRNHFIREAGIDDKTARSWLSVLQGSGVAFLLDVILPSESAGLAKSPKLYFYDTGLACYLCGLGSADAAARGPMAGQLFETFAVSELVKTYLNCGLRKDAVRYYRETSGKKRGIDVVIRDGLTLHPVEVKAAGNPGPDAARHFQALEERFGKLSVGDGEVLCSTDEPYSVARGVRAVSVWDI